MSRLAPAHFATLATLVLFGACDGGTSPTGNGGTTTPVVTRVFISVSEVTLTSLGDTVTLTAQASDASGNTVSGKTFTWASSNVEVATVSTTGLVTAVANGSATITATTDAVNGTATVTVAQVPTSLEISPGIFSADQFTTQVFQVQFPDANGFPVPNVSFLVSADSGVGMISPDSGATTLLGVASVSWTLGGFSETEDGIEAITIVTPNGTVRHTSIIRAMPFSSVQCFDFEHSGFWISAGGCQYAPRAPGSSFDVVFRVTEPDYTPIVGATVTFEVEATCLGTCDNAGSVSTGSSATDNNGQVTVTWTLGPNTGFNRLLVSYPTGSTVGVWVNGQ